MTYSNSKQLNREVQLLNENIETINNFIAHDELISDVVYDYCKQLNHKLTVLKLLIE